MSPHPTAASREPAFPPSAPSDATAWRAVLAHDAGLDGRFVYAVSSTGVFCRPSCPSRRPRRDRVRFFPTAGEARTAGFRPCRRCHPDQPDASPATRAVQRCAQYLRDHPNERTPLQALAALSGYSPFHLQRLFKRTLGISPREFQDALRHHQFSARLRAGDTVSRASFEAGYGSSSRVYGNAEVRAVLTPGTIRRGAPGRDIRFTILAVPLGRLLVAFTAHGVCAVELGTHDAALVQALAAQFPRAQLHRVSTANAWARSVARLAAGRTPSATVPLDAQGTAFQWRVWKALQRIPAGQTRSYSAIARAIGQPRAVRAVASACARNPVALLVPCHRVVRSDGAIGEYRWGARRKARLLRAEHAATDD